MKFNIKNFYIGELYLSNRFGNLFAPTKLTKKDINELIKHYNIVENGAINIEEQYVNYDARVTYKRVLTIFYKGYDEYLCLHNDEKYTVDSTDFYDNLIPLSALLPKIDFNIQEYITFDEAIILFNNIFNNNICHMGKIEFDINDFYVGILNLYTSSPRIENNKKIYYNLSQRKMLYKNGGTFYGFFGRSDCNENNNYLIGTHGYDMIRSIFFKISNNELYNLHNFQIYNQGVLENNRFTEIRNGESFYDYMYKLDEYISQNNIEYSSNKITIPKVLSLYKK